MPYNASLAYCYPILSCVLFFMFILLSCVDLGACNFLVLKQFEMPFLYKKCYTNKVFTFNNHIKNIIVIIILKVSVCIETFSIIQAFLLICLFDQ